jgi:DnaJ-class molecular chaperone
VLCFGSTFAAAAAISTIQERGKTMQTKNPFRQHTPDDDPELGTPGAGQDVCPQCDGTGKQISKETGKSIEQPCERCDGTGKVIQGIG